MAVYSVNKRGRVTERSGGDTTIIVQKLTLGATALAVGDILRFFDYQEDRRLYDFWIHASQPLDSGAGLQFSVGMSNSGVTDLDVGSADLFGSGLTFAQTGGVMYRPTGINHILATPRSAPREVVLKCTAAASTYAGNGKHIYFGAIWVPA